MRNYNVGITLTIWNLQSLPLFEGSCCTLYNATGETHRLYFVFWRKIGVAPLSSFYHSSSCPAPSGCTRIESVSTSNASACSSQWDSLNYTLSREMQLRNGNRTNGIGGCRLDSCASKSRRVWKSPPFLRTSPRRMIRIYYTGLSISMLQPVQRIVMNFNDYEFLCKVVKLLQQGGFIKHPIYVYLRREVAMLKTSNYGSLKILRRN